MSKTTVIDKDGDLVLVLLKPSKEWLTALNEAEYETSSALLARLQEKRGITKPSKVDVDSEEEYSEIGLDAIKVKPVVEEVHFLVSSKHMTVVSRVFKAMLQNNFKEGIELKATGHCTIHLPDDNPTAFEILLNLIHLNNDVVPRKLELQMLANIAVLVDKYELQKSTHLIRDPWDKDYIVWGKRLIGGSNLKFMAEHYPRWLFVRIGICWVLEMADQFTELTEAAIQHTLVNEHLVGDEDEEIRHEKDVPYGIPLPPIPDKVLIAMEKARDSATRRILTFISNTIKDLLHPTYYYKEGPYCVNQDCVDTRCKSLILGTLLQSLACRSLYPVPDTETLTLSYSELLSKTKHMRVSTCCEEPVSGGSIESLYLVNQTHGIGGKLAVILKDNEDRIKGLNMEEFKKHRNGGV